MDYYSYLEKIHKLLKPKSYLEIGIRTGTSLALSGDSTLSIGIDPNPAFDRDYRKCEQIYSLTSDDFFKRYTLTQELGDTQLELAFIDGMHLYEFVLRDFINVEKYATDSTVILLHDIIPRDAESAARDRTTDFWTGDVWRLLFVLLEYRPDLHISIINTGPSGLAVVTNLDSSNRALLDNYDKIIAEYTDLPFSYYLENTNRVRSLIKSFDTIEFPNRDFPNFEDYIERVVSFIDKNELGDAVDYYDRYSSRFNHIPEYKDLMKSMNRLKEKLYSLSSGNSNIKVNR